MATEMTATLLCCGLVLISWWLALQLFRLCRSLPLLRPLLHPLVTGAILIALVLEFGNIDYRYFNHHSQLFYWLLGPATVALALPLHHELKRLQAVARPVLLTLLVGAIISPAIAILLAWCLDGETLLLPLSTKSVTTAIALGIADIIGSVPELVATVVIFTGVTGAMLGPALLRRLGISDERVLGFSLGLNAHGIGTARAFEVSPRCGAWASLAMCLTGLLTTALLPLAIRLLE